MQKKKEGQHERGKAMCEEADNVGLLRRGVNQ
jgi:hypothetical protein